MAVVAHRGSGMAPENTLAAVRLALKQGADIIENDIMRTSDGQLVIMHDVSLARTTDVEEVFPDRSPWRRRHVHPRRDQAARRRLVVQPEVRRRARADPARVGARGGIGAGMLLEAKDPQLYSGIESDIDKELRSIPEFNRPCEPGG